MIWSTSYRVTLRLDRLDARRAEQHRKAVERRKKAKRGGKR